MATTASGKDPVRVKIDENLLQKIINADTHQENTSSGDDVQKRHYEQMCNFRETQIYKLFQDIVNNFNSKLKTRREIIRLVDEGDGLHLELE